MDSFGLTIVIIAATTLIASYIKRITKDKCLKDFEGYIVTLELADGKTYCGKLDVESTGIEIIYKEQSINEGILEMTRILYKDEFTEMDGLIRYHDELTEKGSRKRKVALDKTYHPGILKKMKRKIGNFFKLIKDALVEIANTVTGRLKTVAASDSLTGSDKYTSKLNQELVNTIDASYDPLLEKYIGNIVLADIKRPDGIRRSTGILKEYTQNYIELLDVMYKGNRICDVVFPRRVCNIRGLGESKQAYTIFSVDFDIRRYKRFFSKVNVKKSKNNDGNI